MRIADDLVATEVERPDIDVMFLRTADEVAAMRRGWERLEELVGLRGRSFFGAFYPRTREYRICARVEEGDDPAALGLEPGSLPGGRFLRARLRGPAKFRKNGRPPSQALSSQRLIAGLVVVTYVDHAVCHSEQKFSAVSIVPL